jgi:hypothetical protein
VEQELELAEACSFITEFVTAIAAHEARPSHSRSKAEAIAGVIKFSHKTDRKRARRSRPRISRH